MNINDVQMLDGVPCFYVVDSEDEEDKTLKSDNAVRIIPVHPELTKIGLLTYVSAIRKTKYDKLFPDLDFNTKYPPMKYMSKRFSTFLEAVGAKTKKTSFHSFRHSYRDALREAEIPLEAVRALGGWADDATDALYGMGLKPKTLYGYIEKVRYDGLDLSHLYEDEAKDDKNFYNFTNQITFM